GGWTLSARRPACISDAAHPILGLRREAAPALSARRGRPGPCAVRLRIGGTVGDARRRGGRRSHPEGPSEQTVRGPGTQANADEKGGADELVSGHGQEGAGGHGREITRTQARLLTGAHAEPRSAACPDRPST